MSSKYKILISGGGTGGHIFPALSIANALKRRLDADILFVGADNRMEMEKVPAAGYEIKGLPVAGFDRKNLLRNIGVLLKLRKSMSIARRIVKDFKPDIAIGVGGYCSGPTLKAAQKAGVPTLLQEQNSYAGVTNKLLARKAKKICVAYPEMERFFPADKIVMTGNPVRKDLLSQTITAEKARERFGLNPKLPTVLVVGGSLGARTLNESMETGIRRLYEEGIQVIWQTGKNFGDRGPAAAKISRESWSPGLSPIWLRPMPPPTLWCRVREPAPSANSNFSGSHPCSCRARMLRKTIRQKTREPFPTKAPRSWWKTRKQPTVLSTRLSP